MKEYPKELADVKVLSEVLEVVYGYMENYKNQAMKYEEQSSEDNEYFHECAVEYEAKAEACKRLAVKMAK